MNTRSGREKQTNKQTQTYMVPRSGEGMGWDEARGGAASCEQDKWSCHLPPYQPLPARKLQDALEVMILNGVSRAHFNNLLSHWVNIPRLQHHCMWWDLSWESTFQLLGKALKNILPTPGWTSKVYIMHYGSMIQIYLCCVLHRCWAYM